MGMKFLKYGAVLVALYLVVANSASGGVLKEGATGVGGVVRAFQGR